MRVRIAIALSALAVLGGCGSTDGSTPGACLEGAGVYLRALEDAPGAVRLQGETPISDCLTENQAGGALASVGTAMVAAATELNADARDDLGGAANVRLGYLIGAAQRGADETQGIHAELLRRLAAAARYSPDNRPLPATFLDAYQRGFDAGRSRG
ncbi:MAG TPA: hypothetical protein VFW48_08865 [Solirubrobacterales bacterium]|nr:hypothetical protein [Solirubrobacterales bacterium]